MRGHEGGQGLYWCCLCGNQSLRIRAWKRGSFFQASSAAAAAAAAAAPAPAPAPAAAVAAAAAAAAAGGNDERRRGDVGSNANETQ